MDVFCSRESAVLAMGTVDVLSSRGGDGKEGKKGRHPSLPQHSEGDSQSLTVSLLSGPIIHLLGNLALRCGFFEPGNDNSTYLTGFNKIIPGSPEYGAQHSVST